MSTNDCFPETQVILSASWHRGRWRCLDVRWTRAYDRRDDGSPLRWRAALLYLGPLTLAVKFAPREGWRAT